jgi:putative flippase GtrA
VALAEQMLERARRWTWMLYVGASAAALGFDMGLFLLMLGLGMAPALASAGGYLIGILVHWLISSRLVFVDHAARDVGARNRQKALFVASALVGLAITVGVVGVGHALGFDPRLAKLAAIFVSFQTTYLLRKAFVFAPRG